MEKRALYDYPTEEELDKIKNWQPRDFDGLMDFIYSIWKYSDSGYWKREGNFYYISTAGWSGNESIIAAMQSNYIFWSLYWCQSQRGGHYIFASSTEWVERRFSEERR
jgi:hypothetical protein